MPILEPSIDQLAQRVLRQEGKMLLEASKEAFANFKDPAPGTPIFRDREWIANGVQSELLSGVLEHGAQSVATFMLSADEHRYGIEAIISTVERHPLPAMTCARALHESALMACWLSDPTISTEERLARSSAQFLSGVQGGLPVLDKFTGDIRDEAEIEQVRQKREGAIEFLQGMGMEIRIRESTGQALNVQYGGYVANVVPKVTELSARYTPEAHHMWSINSGAAHSNSWMIRGLYGQWATVLSSLLLPILDVSDALVDNLFGYVGMGTEEPKKLTHQRRMALLRVEGSI